MHGTFMGHICLFTLNWT